ncbi:MAG: hypothetical protein ACYDEX_01375 [Mobilitalea sp.]
MLKKNTIKIVVAIGVITLLLLMFHLIGGNLISMIKAHMGL